MIVCMYYPSTRYISILFYTNKHDKIENNFVILENISLLYNAQEFWKCYTRYQKSKSQLRKYEKRSIKVKKAELDLNFLSNCRLFNVIPKFLAFNLPYSNDDDKRFIRKRLLRSAIKKRKDERYKLEKELKKIHSEVCSILNVTDQYIISSLIKDSVKAMVKSTILTYEKKLRNLTQNTVLPFTSTGTVLNFSSSKLTDEEMNILRYGLKHYRTEFYKQNGYTVNI